MNAKQLKKKQKANDMKCVESRFSFILLICTDSQLCDLNWYQSTAQYAIWSALGLSWGLCCTGAVKGAVLHWGCHGGCAALELLWGPWSNVWILICPYIYFNISIRIRIDTCEKIRNLYNIAPITIQINFVYGQETCIYTIFNSLKGICTTRKSSGSCWSVHTSCVAQTRIISKRRANSVIGRSTWYCEWANPIISSQCHYWPNSKIIVSVMWA